MYRLTAILLTLILTVTLLAGCKNEQDNKPDIRPGDFDSSEYVFVPEFFSPVLPEGMSNINFDNLTYYNDKQDSSYTNYRLC